MAGRTIRSWAVNGWTRDYWLFSLVGRENEVPCRVRNRIEVISGMSHEGFKAFVVRARFTWPVGKSKFRFYRTTGEKAREPLCSRRGLELIAILESNSEVFFFQWFKQKLHAQFSIIPIQCIRNVCGLDAPLKVQTSFHSILIALDRSRKWMQNNALLNIYTPVAFPLSSLS